MIHAVTSPSEHCQMFMDSQLTNKSHVRKDIFPQINSRLIDMFFMVYQHFVAYLNF